MKSIKVMTIVCGLLSSQFLYATGNESASLEVDSTLQVEEIEDLELQHPSAEMRAFEEEFQIEKFARLSEEAYLRFLKDED